MGEVKDSVNQGPAIFVCYAHEDHDVTRNDVAWLSSQGFSLWFDQNISAGALWQGEIARAIDDADIVLFFLSRRSMASAHCDREIAYALDQNKRILPIRLDDEPLTATMRINLGRIQMIDRTGLATADYQQRLMRALDGAPRPVVTPAASRGASRRLPWLPALVVCVLLAASLIGFLAWQNSTGPGGDRDSAARVIRVAVLPFVPATDRELEIADAVADETQLLLARVPGLQVTSRTSAFSFRNSTADLPSIANQLGVSHVIEGSVRRSDGTIRVTAQLIDVATDAQVWSETYSQDGGSPNEVSVEIAAQIARRLTSALGMDELSAVGQRPTDSLEAWQLYVAAREMFRDRVGPAADTEEALSLVTRALDLDETFARAHSLRAALLLILAGQRTDPSDAHAALSEAVSAAANANGLATELGEPYYILARAAQLSGDIEKAARLYEEAVRRAPNNADGRNWYGDFLLQCGYRTRAWSEKQRAIELDPLSPIIFWQVAFAAVALGRLDEVEGFIARSNINGWQGWELEALLGAADMQRGDLASAEAHYRSALPPRAAVIERSFAAIENGRIGPQLRAELDRMLAYGPIGIARFHVELLTNDLDAAFATAWSELAPGQDNGAPARHASGAPRETLRIDWWGSPARPFRQDPRFSDLMNAVGLEAFWAANGWPDLCQPSGQGVVCQ